jgi:hypothetical protein
MNGIGQRTIDGLKICGLCFHGAFPPAARFQAERSPGFRHLQRIIILSTLKSREFDTPLMCLSQLEGFHFKFFHTKIRGPKFCHNGNPFVLIFFTQKLGGPLFAAVIGAQHHRCM